MKRALTCGVLVAAMMLVAGGPATQPSAAPTTQAILQAAIPYPALQKKLRELMEENAALQERIDWLNTRISVLEKQMPRKPAPSDVNKIKDVDAMGLETLVKENIKVGMAELDVRKALGFPTEEQMAGSARILVYNRRTVFDEGTAGHPKMVDGGGYKAEIYITDGVVTSIFASRY